MVESDEIIYKRFLTEHKEDDFRILLERHKESLILFLMSFVHNAEDAEELMLDTYAEIAAGARFSGKSSFKTWLFSIGKHLALMRFRKKRFFLPLEEEHTESVAVQSPELELLKEERNQQLFRALSKLNEEYRQILILLYFENMSIEDAEKVLSKNRKQIYNLTERAKKSLRLELERMGFGYAEYE